MSDAILDDVRRPGEGVAVCWLGNLSWLIGADDRLIAFDLDLEGEARLRESPVAAEDLAPVLDVHFITHGHGDHFGAPTCRVLADESRCVFVLPANCTEKAGGIGIPDERISIARPGEPFDLPGVRVEPERAFHGHHKGMVYRGANVDDCGYLVTIGETRLFQPGDTVLLEQHMDLQDIDVLFISPTEHNMHVEHAALLIETIRPRHVLPQHFDTYVQTDQNRYWTKGYPDELRARLSEPMRERLRLLKQGEVLRLV